MSQALFTSSVPYTCQKCPVLTNVWLTKLRRGLTVALIPPPGLLASAFLGWLAFQVRFFFLKLVLYHLWSSQIWRFSATTGWEPSNCLLQRMFCYPHNYTPITSQTQIKKHRGHLLSPFPSKVHHLLQNGNIQKWQKCFPSHTYVTCVDPEGLCLVL